ncbi:hypothetical protein D3H59_30220, partial [Micromonospora endophytica]
MLILSRHALKALQLATALSTVPTMAFGMGGRYSETPVQTVAAVEPPKATASALTCLRRFG